MSKRIQPAPTDKSIDPAGEFSMNVPEQLFYLLFQIVRHRDSGFEVELAPIGLTVARWRTLAIVRRMDGCTMKELARYSTVDRTTLTRSVDHLVVEGLVDRHVPPKDRRQVVLTLTPAGLEIYDKAASLLMDYNRRLVRGIAPEAQRDLTRTMEAVLFNLFDNPAEPEAIIKFGRESAG